MLQVPSDWVFNSPGPLDAGAVRDFFDLALKIAEQGESWSILELFKSEFGNSSRSSSESWALTDLSNAMDVAAENAPTFIAAFWRGVERIGERYPAHAVPSEHIVNAVLIRHGVPYEVKPPSLLPRNGAPSPVVLVPETTLDDAAKALIQASLAQADRFLLENRPRQAVQEILWLLETVSTAFEGQEYGQGTVEGKYFNSIVRDLRKHNHGTILAQVGAWMATLHGFLSSPTGGGVRHGTNLAARSDLKLHEATLFCNLTRSYIGYLLAELSERTRGSADD